ncbi:MAG: glutamate-cysteine ligase family protein [Acidobacteriota bacterium]
MSERIFHLFEAYGVEIEYMIVDAETLDVAPVADRILLDRRGVVVADLEDGDVTWSNELALHLVELKNTHPSPALRPLAPLFLSALDGMEKRLDGLGCRLLPGGAHPWMDPARDTRLWPHEGREIYETYRRIFGCNSHGWLNLQSVHLNLPFADAPEFARLHAAIRLVLPMLPALAASTPILGGRRTPWMDARVQIYRHNQDAVPSIVGDVIPEPVFSPDEYVERILQPIFRDIAPLDPEGMLQQEWLNSRGAIARFDRNTFEIRLIDSQECVSADLAVADLVTSVLQSLTEERWSSLESQKAWPTARLLPFLDAAVQAAGQMRVSDPEYLACFGITNQEPLSGRGFWRTVAEQAAREDRLAFPDKVLALTRLPTLAERIVLEVERTGGAYDRASLLAIWRRLADCLREDRYFS